MIYLCDLCYDVQPFLDAHHVISQSKGGTNEKSNIANICPNCHRKVHLGLLILEGWFQTTNGYRLLHHFNDAAPLTNELPDTHIFGEKL